MRPLFFLLGSMGLFLTAALYFVSPALAYDYLPVDPPGSVTPNDPYWQRQWYMRQIHLPEAWGVTTGTSDVIIAMIDAGVDITHPELRENIWTNAREVPEDGLDNDGNGYIDDVHGWNFVTKSADVRPIPLRYQEEEAWSHGTFVASLLVGKGNNAQGIAGVNWNARVMPLVALDGDGFGQTTAVVQALRYAVNNGASIVNLSLAGSELDPALEEMIQRANDAGVLVVAATGNDDSRRDGRDIDRHPVYPVCMDGSKNFVLGVGGTDTLDQKSPFANYGQRCTDISAPAQEFFAARPSYPRIALGMASTVNGTTTPQYLDGMTGTSLAAPLVSGVASLIKALRPEATPDQLKNFIIYHADRIEENLTDAQRGKMGSGRLNAFRAVRAAAMTAAPVVPASPPIPISVVATSTVVQGKTITFSLRNHDRVATWIVSQKPIAYGWASPSPSATTTAFVYAVFQDAKGYEWKKWDPTSGVLTTLRRTLPGKGWVISADPVMTTMVQFTHPQRKDAYLLNTVTGQEKRLRRSIPRL